MQPIIIIGTQRSGSNLLRLMLNQHTKIAAPHPPHILQSFSPFLSLYGDLKSDQIFFQLVSDVCDYVMLNPVNWNLELSAMRIFERVKTHSLISIFSSIYDTYAEKEQATHWCCKSMANLYYIPYIEQEGLTPHYIHLIRDGRDVAASFQKTIVGEKHPYSIAKQWQRDQDIAEKNCHEFASDRYIPIMYENLIQDPENTLRILLHHIGLKFEESMLQYHNTYEAQKTAEAGKMWNNVSKPVIAKNSNKFLAQLSEQDILIFESIAGVTLERYGYTPYFNRSKWQNSFNENELVAFEAANKKSKEEAMMKFDPDGIKKKAGQDNLLKEIQNKNRTVENP